MTQKLDLYRLYTDDEFQHFVGPGSTCLYSSFYHSQAKGFLICVALVEADRSFEFRRPGALVWSPYTEQQAEDAKLKKDMELASITNKLSKWVFVRRDIGRLQFIGEFVLGASHPQQGKGTPEFHFLVRPKLTRDLWAEFGTYRGWKMWINGKTIQINVADDVVLERELAKLAEEEIIEITLTRYEEDQLRLIANGESACVHYRDVNGESGRFSRSTSPGAPDATCSLVGFDNHDWETRMTNIVNRNRAFRLLIDYFRKGTCGGPDWH